MNIHQCYKGFSLFIVTSEMLRFISSFATSIIIITIIIFFMNQQIEISVLFLNI